MCAILLTAGVTAGVMGFFWWGHVMHVRQLYSVEEGRAWVTGAALANTRKRMHDAIEARDNLRKQLADVTCDFNDAEELRQAAVGELFKRNESNRRTIRILRATVRHVPKGRLI